MRIDIEDLEGPGVLSRVTAQVSSDGHVSLPQLGLIRIVGSTEAEIQKAVQAAYRKANLMPNAGVTVLKLSAQQAAGAPPVRTIKPRDDPDDALPATAPAR